MGVRGAQTPQSLEQKNLCKGGALQYALYFGNHTTKSMSDEIICYYNHSDGPLQGEWFFFPFLNAWDVFIYLTVKC